MACTFCDIIAGRTEASFVHRGPMVVAFMDINPVTPGHLLVVPRDHFPALKDVDEPLGAEMFSVARMLGQALRSSGLDCEGVNLFYADGEAAGQEVFHSHLHVIPRTVGDGFRLAISYPPRPDRDQLDRHAAMIREAAAGFD